MKKRKLLKKPEKKFTTKAKTKKEARYRAAYKKKIFKVTTSFKKKKTFA